MITLLPDEAAEPMLEQLAGETTLGDIADALETFVGFRDHNGISLGTALRPAESENSRIDRAALRHLVRQFLTPEPLRLDTVSRLVYSRPESEGFTSLPYTLARMVNPRTVVMLPSSDMFFLPFGSRDALRFYGSLSEETRTALWAGKSMTVEMLPPEAVKALSDLVFTRAVSVQTKLPKGFLWQDPTRIAPYGLAAEARLEPKVSIRSALLPVEGTGHFPVESIAAMLFSQRQSGVPEGALDVVSAKFLPCSVREMTLRLWVTREAYIVIPLQDVEVLTKGPVGLSELPPDMQAALTARMNSIEEGRRGGIRRIVPPSH
jgi:hypothetical protein